MSQKEVQLLSRIFKNDIKYVSLKIINYLNKLLCSIKYLEVYMRKWVSVIRYIL